MKTTLRVVVTVTILVAPFLGASYIENLLTLSWGDVLYFALIAAAVGALCMGACEWLQD